MQPLAIDLLPIAKKRINIRSFDFDGCLFNDAFYDMLQRAPNRAVNFKIFWEANKKFFEAIEHKLTTEKYNNVFYTVGSARQSDNIDRVNSRAHSSGSCFPYMKAIQERLTGEVNRFLLADLYNDLPHGACFDQAMNVLKRPNPELSDYGWVFDDSKFTLLYAQIHKFAKENPDVDIDFDFYDDRDDILKDLHSVFNDYPHLLPKNVTLKLHEYSGRAIKDLEKIEGKGPIDITYPRTVKEMVKAHGMRCCAEGTFNVLKEHNKDNINKLLAIRPINSPAPVYPGEPAWYMEPKSVLTAIGAGIGFFATGGVGLVCGAVAGYMLSGVPESMSEINHRQ